MHRDGSLAATFARVHVVRDAVITYREALREGGAPRGADPIHELDAMAKALAQLAYDADPVARELVPEVWYAIDRPHELSLTLRVLTWRHHAVVLAVASMRNDAPRLLDATPVAAVLQDFAHARGIALEQAQAELHVAQWCAQAVDREVQPESWRYRSRLTDDDITLRVQRTGDRPPLIISAEWAPLNAGGGGAGARARSLKRKR